MPVNNFSVGRDITFSIILPSGTLALNGVTDYVAKGETSKLPHKGLDGKRKTGIVPDGWQITVKLDRQDPNVDNLIAQIEAAYFAGTNNATGSITESIQEVGGAVSQFQYADVSVDWGDTGNWKGDSLVSQSLTFFASTRTKTA